MLPGKRFALMDQMAEAARRQMAVKGRVYVMTSNLRDDLELWRCHFPNNIIIVGKDWLMIHWRIFA